MKCVRLDNFYLLLGFLFLGFCAFSCTEGAVSKEFMDYYYPVHDLKDGKIYEYRPVNNDTLPVDYWYYSSHTVGDEIHFTGNYYNDRFQVRQFFRETQGEHGMELQDFILYETNEEGRQYQVKVEVLNKYSFPADFADSTQTYQMGIKWDIPGEIGTTISLNRDRKYLAKGHFSLDDKRYESVLFTTMENIEHFIEDDGYLEPSFPGVEIYAKGIGLVYYKKQLSEDVVIEYELYAIYTMPEFEKKYKRSLKGEGAI